MTTDAPKRILALDPANRTGWAWSDGSRRLHGVWELSAAPHADIGARLVLLHSLILHHVNEFGIELIACEDAHQGSHSRTVAVYHAELRGVIRMAAYRLKVPLLLVNPMTLKKFATGSGRAKKPQMIRACKTLLGIETDDDNVADALFILEFAKQSKPPVAKPKKRRSRKKGPQGRLFK